MGDRVNIVIQDQGKRVFLYGHWAGYKAPEIVRAALARGKDRWTDPSYLARIVFCEMMGGAKGEKEALVGTTGLGISTEIGDNEYPLVIVDCDTQEVKLEAVDHYAPRGAAPAWPFAKYAKLAEAGWNHLDDGRNKEGGDVAE